MPAQKTIANAIAHYAKLCHPTSAQLLAVSKLKPASDVMLAYEAGQRHFAENYVQELVDKYEACPKDIHWHFIGHLQSNKVKYIVPFVHLIQSIDSQKLLQEVSKQAQKVGRVVDVLLQIYIAAEETKFGLDEEEARQILAGQVMHPLPNIRIVGLMGMASFTEDKAQVAKEFAGLAERRTEWADVYQHDSIDLRELSMGMSQDLELALAAGSTMVRIGTAIFGARS